MNSREVAFQVLRQSALKQVLADELLAETLARTPLSPPDRALATELFYGCLRQQLALEYLVHQLVARPPRTVIAQILHLGLYQLLFLDRVPAHAAVHETVELAKRHGSVSETKFVNAILRKTVGATRDQLLKNAEPWVRLSHPLWLWKRWSRRWGVEQTTALCEWNNQSPPVYVRVNTLRTAPRTPLCYPIADPTGLFDSPSWKNGELYVQDPSTLVAVDVLDPQPGESVLDMCAAPGGKTTYIAQKMQNRGRIIAADSSNTRLGLVGENCQRLGVTIVASIPCEGTRLDRCLRGDLFDRVLVDAPCSNTGVMRRRPDLRWRLEEKEITRLAELQTKLLTKAAEFVRPGGVLVYSTCSLEAEENEQVIQHAPAGLTLKTQRQLFPPQDKMDGAFIARFTKK